MSLFQRGCFLSLPWILLYVIMYIHTWNLWAHPIQKSPRSYLNLLAPKQQTCELKILYMEAALCPIQLLAFFCFGLGQEGPDENYGLS